MTARNLSPALRQEFAKLDQDADSRKSAMKALKSYVKDLDSSAIPLFLAKVSETKETGSLPGEYTISLYEVLARVHGPNIVPQIDSIMLIIIKTLASSAGSFPLQQACSKVVPAIARYGIDPTTPEDKKRHLLQCLCKPLAESLLGTPECLTAGAALCLKALVDSDNWRFASAEMVNNVCQNVAVALGQRSTQTNSHMCLVMSLAKHNALIVEAYARLLIQAGLQILNMGVVEGNSQKRLSAIQMVNFMMKCLDPRSIFSELDMVIQKMESCQSDHMPYVKGAAFEALQTARKIVTEKSSKFEMESASFSGSNFSKSDSKWRRNAWSSGDRSPSSVSPESQTLDSFVDEYDTLAESPITIVNLANNFGHDCRSVNRKQWSYENGGVDISLKDGLFSEVAPGRTFSNAYCNHWCHAGLNGNEEINTAGFAGLLPRVNNNGPSRSVACPKKSESDMNWEDNGNFTNPRQLIYSVQDPDDPNHLHSSEVDTERSEYRGKIQQSPEMRNQQNGIAHKLISEENEKTDYSPSYEQVQGGSESVSSTDDIPTEAHKQNTEEVVPKDKLENQHVAIGKSRRKMLTTLFIILLIVLLPIFISLMWARGPNEVCHLVPT